MSYAAIPAYRVVTGCKLFIETWRKRDAEFVARERARFIARTVRPERRWAGFVLKTEVTREMAEAAWDSPESADFLDSDERLLLSMAKMRAPLNSIGDIEALLSLAKEAEREVMTVMVSSDHFRLIAPYIGGGNPS